MTQEESVLVSGHVVRHLALMDYALKKALLCYAVGSSIMLNPEAYYAGNMPTVCL